VRARRLQLIEHRPVPILERSGVDEERPELPVGDSFAGLFPQSGHDLGGRIGKPMAAARVVDRSSPAEVGVGHERPPSPDHIVTNELRQASDVIVVGMTDDQEIDGVRRVLLAEQVCELERNAGVSIVADVITWMGAVDEDRLARDLEQQCVAVLLMADIEKVDP
jgi:hypothetical protein